MAKDPREMTDEELQDLVNGGGAATASKDPREMTDEELQQLTGGSDKNWPGVKRALSNIGGAHLEGAKAALSGTAEGIVKLLAIPQDMANTFTLALTNKKYLDGSDEAIKSLKSLGLDYDPEPNDFSNNVVKKTAELGGGAGAAGFILRTTAQMLQAGKYIPQVVTQAQSVFQRLMTEAANNPGLIPQEINAGSRAGFAHGVLKQLMPNAPWWATFMAELGGGMTANPRKPSPLTVEGQEERVANTIADLNAGGRQSPGVDNKAGLQASLAEGRSRLTNSDGTPIVENFDPTSAQTAVTPTALPDGSTTVTRNLGPYEKATLGGSTELTAKLEGQARAINTATDQTFQNSNATPHPVEPSDAGQTIRQDLLAARQRQQAETENAYRNVNEKASTGMNQLVDDLLHVRASRNEADRAEDMPAEVEALLKTFEPNWPQDVLYKGQPLSYQDFLALRTKALQTKDPQLLSDTDNLMGTYLAPEKQMGLLKDWRTRVMGELEKTGVGGKLKLRLGQVRSSIENAIDSFGVGPGSEAENFRTASAEARKLKETFDSGQVGSVLEKEWGRHVLPESDVPGKFTSANRQPESWDSLVAAAGDPSEATAAARRIVQQRFQAQTTNAPQTPEGVRTPSSEKFNNFLKNPDNKELIVNAFGQEHYDRLRQLEQMARVRETILKSPATAGSNSAEKLKALEQLKSGKELDKLFSSLTLRLGFVARAGRKATEMVYGDANEVMDRLFKDAMVDPELLSGLLSRTRTREAFRARQKYRLYLTQQPSQVEKKLEDSKDERVDLSDLLASDMDARSTSAKYSAIDDLENSGWPNPRGYSTGGKIAKALGAKWFSPLEKAIEEAPEHLNHTLDNWIKYLRGRTTQHGNAPVKDEEIEAVWPTASKLAINPGPDEIYDPKSKFKKDQILEAVREANKNVTLPEFQTRDKIKDQSEIPFTVEQSPLRDFSRIFRSTPESPIVFNAFERADQPGTFFMAPDISLTHAYTDSSNTRDMPPLSRLMEIYNQDAGPKYGEHSNYRLPGGRDYKETVVGSSLSQPMSIDNAHFGSVPGVGQNQVSWSMHHNRFQEGLEPNLPEGGLPSEPQAPMTFTDNDLIERIRNEAPFMPEDRRLNEDPADLWGRISEAQRQQARDQHAQDTGRVWQNPEQAAPEGGPNTAPLTDIRHLANQVENNGAQLPDVQPPPNTPAAPFSNARIARALEAHARTPVNQRPTFGPAQTADEIGLHNPFTDANEEELFPSFEAARAHWTDNYNGMTDEDFQQTARQFLDHYAPMEQPAGQTPNLPAPAAQANAPARDGNLYPTGWRWPENYNQIANDPDEAYAAFQALNPRLHAASQVHNADLENGTAPALFVTRDGMAVTNPYDGEGFDDALRDPVAYWTQRGVPADQVRNAMRQFLDRYAPVEGGQRQLPAPGVVTPQQVQQMGGNPNRFFWDPQEGHWGDTQNPGRPVTYGGGEPLPMEVHPMNATALDPEFIGRGGYTYNHNTDAWLDREGNVVTVDGGGAFANRYMHPMDLTERLDPFHQQVARLQLEGERANQATQGNFPNHQPLGQGEWEVFDPADGRPIHLFRTERDARQYAEGNPGLDFAQRGQGWGGNQPAARQAKLPPPKPKKPTGAKVTFIDELQSYRHQKGANEGYRWADNERKAFEKQLNDVRADVERKFNIATNRPPGSFVNTTSLLDGTAKQLMGDDPDLAKFLKMKEEYEGLSRGTVPDGPYKKSWPLLQFRRMLWQAAQDGSDWLAWNTSKEVQKHGTQPGIADHIYDKTLTSIAKKEARRLGLPEGSVKKISIGKANNKLTKDWDSKLSDAFINASEEEPGPEVMEHLDYLDDHFHKIKPALKKVLSTREYENLSFSMDNYRKYRKEYRATEDLPADAWTDEHDRIMDRYHEVGGNLATKLYNLDLVNMLGLRGDGNSWGLRLTPEVLKKILEEGLPKFMIPATVGAGALAKKDEKPVN